MSSLTITTIQSNIHQENIQANLDMFAQKIQSIPGKKELVILPEMFSTGFSNNVLLAETMAGSAFQWMKHISALHKIILIGSLMIREEGLFYNRLICMFPNGEFGWYNKRHLFAYAREHEFFTPGKKRFVFSVNGWKINAQICYDLRFPVWTRQNMQGNKAEYDILLNVANWPAARIAHWDLLLRARAAENLCYAIGVNRTGFDDTNQTGYCGHTAMIAPDGKIIYQKAEEEDIFTTTFFKENLQKYRADFPFLSDADRFFIH